MPRKTRPKYERQQIEKTDDSAWIISQEISLVGFSHFWKAVPVISSNMVPTVVATERMLAAHSIPSVGIVATSKGDFFKKTKIPRYFRYVLPRYCRWNLKQKSFIKFTTITKSRPTYKTKICYAGRKKNRSGCCGRKAAKSAIHEPIYRKHGHFGILIYLYLLTSKTMI